MTAIRKKMALHETAQYITLMALLDVFVFVCRLIATSQRASQRQTTLQVELSHKMKVFAFYREEKNFSHNCKLK